MRTLELEINWLFYVLALSLIWLGNELFFILDTPSSLLQIVTLTLLFFTLTILILSLTGKRFLHIDKAGVSYNFLGKTHYIHTEHIQAIRLRSLGIVSLPEVYLDDGRIIRFFSWKMNRDELLKAESLVR
ncbi:MULTISPECIES: hypothetical protein [Pseudoalteromonas]|uniref:PH domain-containing protein n=1 Tax=Pseudoalteromonas maricaloris TaxID=184924 RepID=A0A8I2KQL8_9GAMM|nr:MULTISPECIES: hypothetical protein [Pseudoalteromonas]KID37249.1 hypothetical protein QT15_08075 [Pseudoalteromonas flavipulchra NCIMB 2033 = ATCC BAA-314]MBD0783067.1 hypothetical protein [Pseudoalteromonas flavipulchra]MBE0374669.1 hypothetical protein [Pseudoalteromonas flavipulchra NCIMB 2033 = ATCC BAA-314]NLR22058.1 hypothetical protein [Pseudoalteromonas maricaloris]QUI65095.1 hypothetical protein GSF04_22505 [Pseudoalteromonas sp. A22]